VIAIEGFRPTRDNLWKLRYAFNTLAPRSAMRLVLANSNGQPRELEVKASVTQLRGRFGDINDIWDIIRKQENQEQEFKLR